MVTNLAVANVTTNSVTLSLTEVTDGAGQPASYLIRWSSGVLSWASATDVTQGTCAVPLAGTAIGANRSCTVLGLQPGTSYQFQLVAFRGTLNVNAVFGALSNVPSGTTAGSTAPVASVTVSPATASLGIAGMQQFTATLKDASGNVLTNRAVTWTSNVLSVATVTGTGLVTALAIGTTTITASSEGQSGSGSVTVIAQGAWPNQPAGFRLVNDQPWNLLTGNSWNYLRRTGTVDDDIVADGLAPFSASNVLRIIFTAGCCTNAEPGVHWMSLPTVPEIYTGWWMKLSPNWEPNGKITFLWTNNGTGQVYTNLYPPCSYPEVCSPTLQGPPYKIGANTEWAPYGQQVWYPNVTTTWVTPGTWYRVEFYYRWETVPGSSGDGIIRWWVNGVLNGNYTNVHYPNAAGFQQFEFAPTRLQVTAEQYMYIDHTYVSVP